MCDFHWSLRLLASQFYTSLVTVVKEEKGFKLRQYVVNNSFPKKLIVAKLINRFLALAKSRDNYHNRRSLHVEYFSINE